MGVVAQHFLWQAPPMAVVGPLAACPGLSFLPAWQVNRTGRKGSLQVNENSESVRAGIVCTHHCMYTSLYVHIIVCTHHCICTHPRTRSNKIKKDQTRSKKTGITAPPCFEHLHSAVGGGTSTTVPHGSYVPPPNWGL
jgi:cytochrome bd-type quinol oxidase subunit 1